MLQVPDRISALVQRLEAGTDPTPDELRRITQLQALDIAKLGEDFVKQMCDTEDARTAEFVTQLES